MIAKLKFLMYTKKVKKSEIQQNMKIKILSLLLLFFLVCADISAGNGIGGTAFQILTIPMNASDAALSNTNIANLSSVTSNPAVIPFAPYMLVLTHAVHIENTGYSAACFNVPINKNSGIGVSVVYFDMGTLTRMSETGIEQGTFGANDKVVTLSYGLKFNESFAAGISAKYLQQKIDDVSYSGYAASLSGLYLISDTFYIGSGINNFGSKVNGFELPTDFYLAVTGNVSENSSVVAQFDSYFNDDINDLKLAAETKFENLRFRIGYRFPLVKNEVDDTTEFISNLTAGLGLNFDFLSVDYAWLPKGDVGTTHMFSILIKF